METDYSGSYSPIFILILFHLLLHGEHLRREQPHAYPGWWALPGIPVPRPVSASPSPSIEVLAPYAGIF